MYQVSDEYRAKMLDQVQTHRLSGTIDGIPFSERDVIGVSYSGSCNTKKVNIGSVNIGVLKLTFLRDILERGDYQGKTIIISDGLLLGYDEHDEQIWESVPVGIFYVAEATWRAESMVDITAYDCISKMDKTLNLDQSSGIIYSWCSYIATQTGTTFGMTAEEVQALPNGTELFGLYEGNELETYRDLLSALAQLVGGFVYAAKDGTWKLRVFDDTSVVAIPKNRRMSGAKFSDFTTLYDAVSYVAASDGLVRVVGDANGVILKLGTQPFLQMGSAAAIDRRVNTIVDSVERMTYTPFEVSMLPAFVALDLGDVVELTDDYTGETSIGAVMAVTWTYNKSFKVSCYGDNPELQSAQSKTDKNISGLMRETTKNEVTYYNFANLESITFGAEVETSIAKLRFVSAQATTVKILHEFIFDMLSDLSQNGSYEVHYYLDDELLTYSPYERLGGIYGGQSGDTEFSITRDLFYILKDVEPNIPHTWEVRVITHGIEQTTIGIDHAHVTLEGQRMYGESYFSGVIEAKDTISVIGYGYLQLISITDEPVVTINPATMGLAADSIGMYDFSTMSVVPIAEGEGVLSPHIYLQTEYGHILTESEDYLTTENGDRLIL